MDINTQSHKKVFLFGRIIIFATAALVAVLQANEAVAASENARLIESIVMAAACIGIISFCAAGAIRKSLKEEAVLICMILGGMLLRAFFVLGSDIWTLQNDTGTYTGFATDQINIGHIGYIEYIYKFMHLPDMDPYDVFGYFHPPVHHILEALWLTAQRLMGVPEDLLFENMQVLTLLYSGLCMLVMLHILKECGVKGKALYAGMALFCFYPRMIVFAGSVNNDILALLLLLMTIWRTLSWCREKSYKNIVLLALCLGIGMIAKLNTAICAFSIALVFFVYLVDVLRSGNLVALKKTLLQYVLFGAVSIPVGMSFILRNLIVFGKKPGLPTQGEASVMYTGQFPLWSRIGVPTLADLHIDFPFHPISGEVSHNTWVILFQTGLFAESYPADIGMPLLRVAQIGYVCSITAAVIASVVFLIVYAVKMFKGNDGSRLGAAFVWSTYVMMLLSYVLYVIKYPYTCSSDFRYMAASLVFTSLGFAGALSGAGDDGERGRVGADREDGGAGDDGENGGASGRSIAGKVFGAAMSAVLFVTLICSSVYWMAF